MFDKITNKKLIDNQDTSSCIQTIGKILPIPMVCGPDFSSFFVVADKQGYKVLAIYSETNNSEKLRLD